ncbi:MAG: helix-turn-helix transcriptional regulator [Clostridia bacterium]|jgi:transcriptional regulator with XRE-family HTH domain|nr:helix-turn-helix transcriptional regulator [Clostridia bacterium]
MKNNIKKIRKKQNISQKQLAEYLDVSQQAVSYIENGVTNISSEKMKRICEFLKSDLLEVFPEMNVMNK